MITIDELRKLAIKYEIVPKYFGIGMVRLKFSTIEAKSTHQTSNLAYHFYSERTDAIGFNPIHDHVFTFKSKVLKGTLRSEIYEFDVVDEETNYALKCIPYADRDENNTIHPNIIPRKACTFDTIVGEEYSINYRTLHHADRITPTCVTLVDKDIDPLIKQDSFYYILDKEIPFVNTAIHTKSVDECWDIIEDILLK